MIIFICDAYDDDNEEESDEDDADERIKIWVLESSISRIIFNNNNIKLKNIY